FACLFHLKKHPPLNLSFIAPLIPLSLLSFHVGQTLFLKGLELTTTTNAAIISTTIPIFTVIVVVFFKEEKFTLIKGIGFVMAFIGVLTLRKVENFNLSNHQLLGDIYVLMASICYALFIAFGKKFLEKYDNLWVTVWLLGISSLTMLPFSYFYWTTYNLPLMDAKFILSAAYCIVGATILTYFLNNYALSKLKSSQVAFFIYLQPVVVSLIAFFFLKETISMRTMGAITCIFCGQALVLINLKKLHERKSH
ncbi:MAG: hypothetical protein A2328_00225, partial [Bdellovibrionales bacterium RIFOXYB2_FULL_36_6]